jgi:hypothetical protein
VCIESIICNADACLLWPSLSLRCGEHSPRLRYWSFDLTSYLNRRTHLFGRDWGRFLRSSGVLTATTLGRVCVASISAHTLMAPFRGPIQLTQGQLWVNGHPQTLRDEVGSSRRASPNANVPRPRQGVAPPSHRHTATPCGRIGEVRRSAALSR